MKIGLFGKQLAPNFKPALDTLINCLIEKQAKIWIHPQFNPYFNQNYQQEIEKSSAFMHSTSIPADLDYLITIDPHLHRYHSLSEIYSIPAQALHATDIIGHYLKQQVSNPLVIGPDEESEQWAKNVAQIAGCDYLVLRKTRSGDRDVAIHIPDVQIYADHQPVLVDDIISTGRTMLRTADELVAQGLNKPLCIGVHAVFAEGGPGVPSADEEMRAGPIAGIVTCNCIPHVTNGIDISPLLVPAIQAMLHAQSASSGDTL